jgi:hypothetical protein
MRFAFPLIASLGLGACVTLAQEQQPVAQNQEMQKVANVLAGNWRFKMKSEPTPDGNAVQTGEGLEIWRTGPGGMPLIEENHIIMKGQDFYDYAAIWWDDKARQARGIWCDTGINDQGCTSFEVQSEGAQVVLIGEYEQKGNKFAWREVFARTSPTSLTQTLFIGEPGGLLKQVSTVNATIVNVAEAPGSKSRVTQ